MRVFGLRETSPSSDGPYRKPPDRQSTKPIHQKSFLPVSLLILLLSELPKADQYAEPL